MDNRHLQAFWDETKELLAALEHSLLQLEQAPTDLSVVNEVFRIMHTIKGTSAMFGYEQVSAFTHDFEALYELVRNGKILVTPERKLPL